MQKPLFALAALLATALVVALAWGLSALLGGALALPKWALIAIVGAVLLAAQFLRWRRRARQH